METVIKPAYSVNEAANYLRISRRQLYRLIEMKEIVPVKLGGRTVIPGQTLRAILREEN